MKSYLQKNRLFIFFVCFLILYIMAFFLLEFRDVELHVVSSRWDQYIPFCEYFIVPYVSWFLYIAVTAIYFLCFCRDERESKRYVASFCTGMIVFILVSLVYPNGHNLRPELEGNNIFITMVRILHRVDTPTNILPSMHVFIAVVNSVALLRQQDVRKSRLRACSIWIGSILIILSTMFLKQHSVVDVVLALLLNIVCYFVFYKIDWEELGSKDVIIRRI